MKARVLFISKPVSPPWNDGSKNLTRDIVNHLSVVSPTVLSTGPRADLAAHVRTEVAYASNGRFAPSMLANLGVAARLAVGDPHDHWHLVFAPSARTLGVLRAVVAFRRRMGFRGRVVHTLASAPRSFQEVAPALFADVIVTVSEHSRESLIRAGVPAGRVRTIVPSVDSLTVRPDKVRAVREELGLGDAPYFVYPGDLEVSSGAETVADAAPELLSALPGHHLVFACREKTERATALRKAIQSRLSGLGSRVHCTRYVSDMQALLAAARVVLFPVDDLYAKVDLPLVLLEAIALGTPIIVSNSGPLREIESARAVSPRDSRALAEAARELDAEGSARQACIALGAKLAATKFSHSAMGAAYDSLYAELG